MKINDIILIISIIIIINYVFYCLTNKTENFTTGGEVDQNYTTYLTRGYVIAPGTVVMWAGNISSIPIGYVLCDGTNGTPDLRDKFVVGASTNLKYKIGNIGGNDSVTLATNQLPAHNHTGKGTSDNSVTNAMCGTGQGGGPYYLRGKPGTLTDCQQPVHNHTFSFTSDNTGGNLPIDIRPNYYALAFIMKTAN